MTDPDVNDAVVREARRMGLPPLPKGLFGNRWALDLSDDRYEPFTDTQMLAYAIEAIAAARAKLQGESHD